MMTPKKRIEALKSHLAASGAEYAIVVGLVALAGAFAVAATGNSVANLFTTTNTAIEDSGAAGNAPIASLESSSALVPFEETATFTWSVTDAASVSARYTLSQFCPRLESLGAGPHALPWTGRTGSQDITWAPDIAGCRMTAEILAANAAGQATAAASTTFAVPDTTPESIAFAPLSGVDPGSFVSSAPATIEDIQAPTTISSADPDVRLSLADDASLQQELTVPLGAQVRLYATAPANFSATRHVPFTAGGQFGTWLIATRAADTTALPFDLGQGSLALTTGADALSNIVTFEGFEVPLDLVITPDVNDDAGTLAYRLGSGSWMDLIASDPVTIANIAENTTLQLRLRAADSYQPTAESASVTVAIGGQSDSWSAGLAAQDVEPNPFGFTNPSARIALGATALSQNESGAAAATTLDGFTGTMTLRLVAGGTAASAGGTYAYSTDNGQSYTNFTGTRDVSVASPTHLRLRMTGATGYNAGFDKTGTITATLGQISRSWSVTTVTQDQTPDAFTFADDTGLASASAGTLQSTGPVNLTGFTGRLNLVLTASGGSGWQYNLGDGWLNVSSGATIPLDHDTTAEVTPLSLRMNAPAAGGSAYIRVNLKGVTDDYDVTVQQAHASCAADPAKEWSVKIDRDTTYYCRGPLTAGAHGTTQSVTNTWSGMVGQASFTCDNGTWEIVMRTCSRSDGGGGKGNK